MYSVVVRLQILGLQDNFAPINQIDATAVALTEVLNHLLHPVEVLNRIKPV
jgi:hypothetical protein